VRALAVVASDVAARVGADPVAQMRAVVHAVLREGTLYQRACFSGSEAGSEDVRLSSGSVTPPDPGSPRWAIDLGGSSPSHGEPLTRSGGACEVDNGRKGSAEDKSGHVSMPLVCRGD
jgi:hypothetical protein